jgi:hypothetical protein
LAVLGGCSDDGGPECLTNADCEGAAICLDGECRILGCQGGCPDGTYCDETSDECVACDVDEHCGAACIDCSALATDRACVDGQCGCRSDFHCATGQTCEAGQCGGCTPDCTGKCGGAGDGCSGTCDDPCAHGYWCVDQVCESCRPAPTELTCGSTAGGDLNYPDDTTDLFDAYGIGCNWQGSPLDGREATYAFSFSGMPNQRNVTVTVYSVCGVSEIIGVALAGDHPCDPDQCVANQMVSGFV